MSAGIVLGHPLVRALAALEPRAIKAGAGLWRLDGRLIGAADLVRAANQRLSDAGYPAIPYPGVVEVAYHLRLVDEDMARGGGAVGAVRQEGDISAPR